MTTNQIKLEKMMYSGSKVLDILDYKESMKQPNLNEVMSEFDRFGIGINSIGLPLYEKATKKQLVNYIKHIEVSIGSYKKIYNELENDHKQLN
jgi:hypothetical protein